jgi:hypothetical protein
MEETKGDVALSEKSEKTTQTDRSICVICHEVNTLGRSFNFCCGYYHGCCICDFILKHRRCPQCRHDFTVYANILGDRRFANPDQMYAHLIEQLFNMIAAANFN